MLTSFEQDLIQRHIDGETSPVEDDAVRALLARQPEARALAADLLNVVSALDAVQQCAPPPRLRPAILQHIRARQVARAPARAGFARVSLQSVVRWWNVQLRILINPTEGRMNPRIGLVIGSVAVATVAVVGALAVGYPPTGREVGTIGGDDPMSGVQQASRYRGRAMSSADVSITDPQIQLLLQNHEVLRLVRSDAFREAMRSPAFREAMASEALRKALASEAMRKAMASEAFHQVMASEALRKAMASEAFRESMATAAWREAMSAEALHSAMASEALRQEMASEALRVALSSEALRVALSSDAMRAAMANEAFRFAMASDVLREAMASAALREAMATAAFRQLQASEAFRMLSRNQAAAEAFLSEAMRAQL
jgi:hypothetical protein